MAMSAVDLVAIGVICLAIGQLTHLYWHWRRGDF